MEDVAQTLMFVALGLILGVVGQGARVIVGLKKQIDDPSTGTAAQWFDTKRLVVSLLIGAVAGSLGAAALLGSEINKALLLTLIGTGYAGADFIEGFMRAWALKGEEPKPQTASQTAGSTVGGGK